MSARKKRRKAATNLHHGGHAPKRRRSRRRAAASATTHHRRRSNPTMFPVILANPRRSRKRRAAAKRTHHGRSHHSSARRRRHGHHAGRRSNPFYTVEVARRRRRRSNPSGMPATLKVGTLVRIGAFGGAGIVWARIIGAAYTQYVSQYVRGLDAIADPTNWRNYLDEAVRLFAMEAGVVLASYAIRRVVKPLDRTAFLVGGSAEVARQAVGVTIKILSPGTDRTKLGLDGMRGMGCAPAGYVAPDGTVLALNAAGTAYEPLQGRVLDPNSFREIAGGMSGPVMSRSSFVQQASGYVR